MALLDFITSPPSKLIQLKFILKLLLLFMAMKKRSTYIKIHKLIVHVFTTTKPGRAKDSSAKFQNLYKWKTTYNDGVERPGSFGSKACAIERRGNRRRRKGRDESVFFSRRERGEQSEWSHHKIRRRAEWPARVSSSRIYMWGFSV